MTRKAIIHQMAPGFLYGDAIGNQAFRIRDQLRQWGYTSQVYAQFQDRRVRDPGRYYLRYQSNRDHILLFHYSIGSPLTPYVLNLPDIVVPYYHNVTPPEFIRDYNPEFAALLERGRRELTLFKDAPFALAASEYNRQEMLALGFKHVEVLPYFVFFDELRASARNSHGIEIARRYHDDWVNLLFVGRLVPNKKQDDLIRTFNYYHRLINPHSRLILIGSDANTPGYRLELQALAEAFDLQHVEMPGAVGLHEGLGSYYAEATVFVCLSEHEGFCVPLLEAMAFDVPVLAYHAAGVPYVLGGAGVLIKRKEYSVIGEVLHLLATDTRVHAGVITGQRRRLNNFTYDATANLLQRYVAEILGLR